MNLLPVAAALIVISVALAGFGAYEYSQYSYETGVANGLSTQVSSLSSASSTLQAQLSQAQANLTAITILKDSLQTQLTQANANVTSLQGQKDSLQTQLTQANANVTSLQGQKDSLQTQLTQANANVTSLQGQISAINGQITQLKGQISADQSLLSLSVVNTLISSQTFNVTRGGSASSVNFPFVSAITPRSWGDVGVVVTGQGTTTPRVSQTGFEDCIDVQSCSVGLNGTVAAGDILLVFVSGYSPNPGWRGQSVNDSFRTPFSLYNGVNWQATTNTYLDSVYYGIATSSGSADSVNVTYSSVAQHSDPIVMDVTGSNLSMYSGASAVCTVSCTTNLMTSPAQTAGNYIAAATAYSDLGVAATAGSGWTQVTTGAVLSGANSSFITGEYSTGAGGGGCSVQQLLPSNYMAKYPGYLSISGTASSAATLLVSYPGTTQTIATYPLGTVISATIPIIPGNVNVQLENCGTASFVATLTVKEVT